MQRLRLRFCRGEEIKFISHLDIMRLWQRVLNRAGIALAYSEGFNPRPRISLAAPLAIGVTSEAELMDIYCTRWASPHWFTAAVSQQIPTGIRVLQVYPIALTQPSLQAQVRYAEYRVEIETEKEPNDIESELGSLLSVEKLPWQHQRDTGIRSARARHLQCGLARQGRIGQAPAQRGLFLPPEGRLFLADQKNGAGEIGSELLSSFTIIMLSTSG